MNNPTQVADRDKYILDGRFCLDAVIRYETLHNDMKHVCEQLGVVWDPASLPIFKTGIRPKEGTVENMYSDKAKCIVQKAFSFELDYFNYTFPADT